MQSRLDSRLDLKLDSRLDVGLDILAKGTDIRARRQLSTIGKNPFSIADSLLRETQIQLGWRRKGTPVRAARLKRGKVQKDP